MNLQEKLQLLRKKNGFSQEQLADEIGIARQTIGKWETGQATPELNGLLSLSKLYGVTIDQIVKEDDCCSDNNTRYNKDNNALDRLADFLVLAKRNTYAAKGSEVTPSRKNSHDYRYADENGYIYYDTYLGSEKFSGEEAVWMNDTPVWSMNYMGRVTGEHFSGDFLKDALLTQKAIFLIKFVGRHICFGLQKNLCHSFCFYVFFH